MSQTEPTIVLCTLVLNEMEWLSKLYEQHKDWPGLARWVFVESADRVYAETTPGIVTAEGLSTDGTTEFLADLAKHDDAVVHIPFGFCGFENPAQGKCQARTAYLRSADEVRPDFLFVLDADEFYPYVEQTRINRLMLKYRGAAWTGYCFRHRHPWRPPSIVEQPLFQLEVKGGFWDIPLCRGWQWTPGLVYRQNHNTPELNGQLLDKRLMRVDRKPDCPECVHMAFSSSLKTRHAKHAYYAARGEAVDEKRSWYVESRAAFETWRLYDELPHEARVQCYKGQIPECFQQEQPHE